MLFSSRYGGTHLLSQHSRGRSRRNSNNSLVSKARPYLQKENDILFSDHVQKFSFSIYSQFILNLSCFLIIFCSIFIFFLQILPFKFDLFQLFITFVLFDTLLLPRFLVFLSSIFLFILLDMVLFVCFYCCCCLRQRLFKNRLFSLCSQGWW